MDLGQAGEHLAASVLSQIGVQVMLAPTRGCDLLAYSAPDFWRVEVKATAQPVKNRPPQYAFSTTRGNRVKHLIEAADCDLVAFVALDVRRVVFRHIATVNNKVTRIQQDEFHQGCEAKTWKEATGGSD